MRKKILLVEDNTELLELVRSYLKAAGFAIATATNGIEALKKARSVSPDLVLLDLVLPELDGVAVYETLRKTSATASVPILILTGLTSHAARSAVLKTGPCDIITKPVNPKHLVARINELLRPARGPCGAHKGQKLKCPELVVRTPMRKTERGAGLQSESRCYHGPGR